MLSNLISFFCDGGTNTIMNRCIQCYETELEGIESNYSSRASCSFRGSRTRYDKPSPPSLTKSVRYCRRRYPKEEENESDIRQGIKYRIYSPFPERDKRSLEALDESWKTRTLVHWAISKFAFFLFFSFHSASQIFFFSALIPSPPLHVKFHFLLQGKNKKKGSLLPRSCCKKSNFLIYLFLFS